MKKRSKEEESHGTFAGPSRDSHVTEDGLDVVSRDDTCRHVIDCDKSRAPYREDSRNYRKHSRRNLAMIDRSFAENGAGRSILLDNTGESIAGSGTLRTALRRGVPIREVHTDGTELIAVIRDDIGPDDPRRRRLALADNAATDASDWDFDAMTGDGWTADDLSEWGVEIPEEYDKKSGGSPELKKKTKKDITATDGSGLSTSTSCMSSTRSGALDFTRFRRLSRKRLSRNG